MPEIMKQESPEKSDVLVSVLNGSEHIMRLGQMETYGQNAMRHTRPFYLVTFLVYFALIFSSSALLSLVEEEVVDDSMYPLPSWFLFASVAVFAPAFLALSQVLPNPSIAVVAGGCLTSVGLLWTGLDDGHSQLFSFGVLTGAGLCLSMQASAVTVSPYFVRSRVTLSALILVLCMAIALFVHPLMFHLSERLGGHLFLYLSPVALVSSLLPSVGHWWSARYQNSGSQCCEEPGIPEDQQGASCDKGRKLSPELPRLTNFMELLRHNVTRLLHNDSWGASLLSGAIWISWGAGVDITWVYLLLSPGVDTTWLSMGWKSHYVHSGLGLSTLQIFLSFVLLAVKLLEQYTRTEVTHYRSNLSSNYMQIGLCGVAGVALCLFPDSCNSYHNHLLFTLGLAMQYDDVSDLYLVPLAMVRNGVASQHYYQVVKHDFNSATDKEEEGEDTLQTSTLVNMVCLACHMMTLVLMALLVMVLGIQIANIMGFLTTVTPLFYLFNRNGLLVMSVTAVAVSLTRPDFWIRHGSVRPLVVT
ncbi:uncharacterized protein LOC101846774 [Aplysia californica]|uniref:Uncharacterized protein LOC101846774 n=1 Tax=Aplysia californica TaxID=6500 RepID=A0ABM0K750_APLCA|nr:uncharacterized protein LOC101846774 [Aplysia californica]